MKTLVLKCDGVVTNDNLRKMNEFRFIVKKSGTVGLSNPTAFKIENPATKWEILEGNGYFSDAAGSSNFGTSREGELVYIVAYSDLIVSISNFDIVTNTLGNSTTKFDTIRSDDGSTCEIETKELQIKKFLEAIYLGNLSTLKGNVIDLGNITELKEVVTGSATALNGKLSQLPNNIERFDITTVNAMTLPGGNVMWSMEQIAQKPKLNRIVMNVHPSTGGDIYAMLATKSGDFYLSANRASVNPNTDVNALILSCSYRSGSLIPTINLKKFNLYASGIVNKATIMSFMQLLKDGIDSGKIQVNVAVDDIAFSTSASVINDAEVISLKETLSSSPYNVPISLY